MKKVDNKSLALFFENLSFLIGTGTDPLTSVTTLAGGADKPTAEITRKLIKDLTEGKDLSQAFSAHKSFFRDSTYSIYISAGLKSGELEAVLLRLAQNLTTTAGIKKQITGAMMYPAFLMIITVIASIYMFTSIVPQIGENVKEFSGGELPYITQAAMSISNFLINQKVALLVYLLIAIVVTKFLFSAFRPQISKAATKLPAVGKLIIQMNMSSFYTNMSHMLSAGIPISECLSVCSGGVSNRYIKNQLTKQAISHNERGSSLSDFMSALPFTAPSERQCIVIAESTGRLTAMFAKIADRTQAQLQQTIKTTMSLVEPAMLLIMGGIIGSIVFAVYLPILSMTNF